MQFAIHGSEAQQKITIMFEMDNKSEYFPNQLPKPYCRFRQFLLLWNREGGFTSNINLWT